MKPEAKGHIDLADRHRRIAGQTYTERWHRTQHRYTPDPLGKARRQKHLAKVQKHLRKAARLSGEAA